LVDMKDATHIWYNSEGQALNVDILYFMRFMFIYDHEILDKYDTVARSLQYVNK
jgi:hypothetical protein